MSAVRAMLEPKAEQSSRRTAARRRLLLPTEGSTAFGTSNVLVLNVSKTGLLLETSADLSEGETIEIDFPETVGVRAVVKWSSGKLFGCKFHEPISTAAVSAALLRASHDPSSPHMAPSRTPARADGYDDEDGRLPFASRMRWIIALALLSWAVVIAAVASLTL